MKIATLRLPGRLTAARVDGDLLVEIPGFSDVGVLVQFPNWEDIAAQANGPIHHISSVDFAPAVPQPGKILCIGMNYRAHIAERGTPMPEFPTVFGKFADALAGPHDDIPLPPEDHKLDWEAELAVIIGAPGRRIHPNDAMSHVAGYTILNDVSMRGYQNRTQQWLQGKIWQNSTPLGPVVISPDELSPDAIIRTRIDGEIVQESTIDDLLFDIPEIIAYLSTFVTLRPGDVISTGTPSGVGVAQQPPRFLQAGELLETSIDNIGSMRNYIVSERMEPTSRRAFQTSVALA